MHKFVIFVLFVSYTSIKRNYSKSLFEKISTCDKDINNIKHFYVMRQNSIVCNLYKLSFAVGIFDGFINMYVIHQGFFVYVYIP